MTRSILLVLAVFLIGPAIAIDAGGGFEEVGSHHTLLRRERGTLQLEKGGTRDAYTHDSKKHIVGELSDEEIVNGDDGEPIDADELFNPGQHQELANQATDDEQAGEEFVREWLAEGKTKETLEANEVRKKEEEEEELFDAEFGAESSSLAETLAQLQPLKARETNDEDVDSDYGDVPEGETSEEFEEDFEELGSDLNHGTGQKASVKAKGSGLAHKKEGRHKHQDTNRKGHSTIAKGPIGEDGHQAHQAHVDKALADPEDLLLVITTAKPMVLESDGGENAEEEADMKEMMHPPEPPLETELEDEDDADSLAQMQ